LILEKKNEFQNGKLKKKEKSFFSSLAKYSPHSSAKDKYVLRHLLHFFKSFICSHTWREREREKRK